MTDQATITSPSPHVELVSCGALHGPPPIGHITLDLRTHFKDPHVTPELREGKATDESVRDAVLGTAGIKELIAAAVDGVRAYRGGPVDSPVRIVTFCQGGRHRAPLVAMELDTRLRNAGLTTKLIHRDIDKPVVERAPATGFGRHYKIVCPAPDCGSAFIEEYGIPIPHTDDYTDAVRCLVCNRSWVCDPAADASCVKCGGSGLAGGAGDPCPCRESTGPRREDVDIDDVIHPDAPPRCCDHPMILDGEERTWKCQDSGCDCLIFMRDDDRVRDAVWECDMH